MASTDDFANDDFNRSAWNGGVGINQTILRHLIIDQEYARRVLPHIKPEFFGDRVHRAIFESAAWFLGRYEKDLTVEAILADLEGKEAHTSVQLTDEEWKRTQEFLKAPMAD